MCSAENCLINNPLIILRTFFSRQESVGGKSERRRALAIGFSQPYHSKRTFSRRFLLQLRRVRGKKYRLLYCWKLVGGERFNSGLPSLACLSVRVSRWVLETKLPSSSTASLFSCRHSGQTLQFRKLQTPFPVLSKALQLMTRRKRDIEARTKWSVFPP